MDEDEKLVTFHWILFLLTNILTQPFMANNPRQAGISSEKVQNDDICALYKFITLGLGGFIR